MRGSAFTVDGIPFRPLMEQIISRALLRSPAPATRTTGRILLLLSTLELVQLAIADFVRSA